MKRFIVVSKLDKKRYEVVDILTGVVYENSVRAIKIKVKSKEWELENAKICKHKLVIDRYYNKIKCKQKDNVIYILARYDNQIIILSKSKSNVGGGKELFTVNVSIGNVDKISDEIDNSEIEKYYMEISRITNLEGINLRVDKYNVKAKIIGKEIQLFPIDNENVIMSSYPKNGIIEIPHFCNSLGYSYKTYEEINSLNSYSADEKLDIQSGYEYIKYIYQGVSFKDVKPEKFNNIIEMGGCSFNGCTSEHLVIPKTCSHIGDSSFAYSRIKNVEIESNEITIGSHAFFMCCELESLNIKGHFVVGYDCFLGCGNLKKIEIPNALLLLKDEFKCCTEIEELTLSKEILYISKKSFENCKNLKVVNIPKIAFINPFLRRWVRKTKKRCPQVKIVEI